MQTVKQSGRGIVVKRAPPAPPRPPVGPPPVVRAPPGEQPSTGRQLLRVGIVLLTVLGIFFAIVAVLSRNRETTPSAPARETSASGVNTASPGDGDGARAVAATGETERVAEVAEGSKPAADTKGESGEKGQGGGPQTGEKAEVGVEGLNRDVGAAERNLDLELARADTSVYKRIRGNIRHCVQIQLAVLKNTRMGKDADSGFRQMQERFEDLEHSDDGPYYTGTIAEYSRLMAEASIGVCTVLSAQAEREEYQRLKVELAGVPRPALEATCDAAFLTASALLVTSMAEGRNANVSSLTLGEIRKSIQHQRSKEAHILKKTEEAHRVLCDVLVRCIRGADRTGRTTEAAARIEKDREQDMAKAKDSFERVAVYTEGEARLMGLWARTLAP